ncbi:MAG: DMT family transporter [Spirochaetes bacterium]|nr:DMT family transporter [Spirochaetota bacterium]
MWILLGALSALFLGAYDVAKKHALRGNAVLPVLFLSVSVMALVFAPFALLSAVLPDWASGARWFIPPPSCHGHLLILAKSAMVVSSWICAFYALKNLPVSVVTPIRASEPLWTLFGAMTIFGERLGPWQWAGLALMVVSYGFFGRAGEKEGIRFSKNPWILLMALAAIIGTGCSLWDKYLLSTLKIDRLTVQAWYCLYNAAILLLVCALVWYPRRRKTTPFSMRPSILAIGLLLVVADFVYFKALAITGALVALLTILRRSSVLVSFSLGGFVFREQNLRAKFFPLLGILAGAVLIILASAK